MMTQRWVPIVVVMVLVVLAGVGCTRVGCCQCRDADGTVIGNWDTVDERACARSCGHSEGVQIMAYYPGQPCEELGASASLDPFSPVGPGEPGNVFETGLGPNPPSLLDSVDLSFGSPSVTSAPQGPATIHLDIAGAPANGGHIVLGDSLFTAAISIDRSAVTGSLDLHFEPRAGNHDFIQVANLDLTMPGLSLMGLTTGSNVLESLSNSLASNGRWNRQTGVFELYVPLRLVNALFPAVDDFKPRVVLSGTLNFHASAGASLVITDIHGVAIADHEALLLDNL